MAGLDADSTLITGTGLIYAALASDALPLPTDINDALDLGFVNVGYTDVNGITYKRTPTRVATKALQNASPIDYRDTEVVWDFNFKMMQWTRFNFDLTFGSGGTWTTTANGSSWTPPAVGKPPVITAVVYVEDGPDKQAWILKRSMAGGAATTNTVKRGDANLLDVSLQVLGGNDGQPALGFLSSQAALGAVVNEAQLVTVTATAGAYTLANNTGSTPSIAYNASTSVFQNRMDTIWGAGNTLVGGTVGAYTVTFQRDLAGRDVEQMTVPSVGNTLTGGTAVVTTTTPGAPE